VNLNTSFEFCREGQQKDGLPRGMACSQGKEFFYIFLMVKCIRH
jgi:hypothetical protein